MDYPIPTDIISMETSILYFNPLLNNNAFWRLCIIMYF